MTRAPEATSKGIGVGGWDRCFQVASVDDLAAYLDGVNPAGVQVSELLTVTPGAKILMPGQHTHLPGRREPNRRLGEVLAHLLAGRPLVVAGILACLVDAVLAEGQRVHSVIRGGDMQADERIRLQPMTTRGMTAIDHRHMDVLRLGHQCVGKREAAGPRPYD